MKTILFLTLLMTVGCKSSNSPVGNDSCQKKYPEVQKALGRLDQELGRLEAIEKSQHGTVDEVVRKLGMLYDVDQFAREAPMPPPTLAGNEVRICFGEAFNVRLVDIGQRYTSMLKSILAEHGWARISVFGEEADYHAWMLVQHADQDRAFQREVLTMLEPLADAGETHPKNFAYLYDRLAFAADRPQRYGTQTDCNQSGGVKPIVLEDPEHVDTLRTSVGLPPFEITMTGAEIRCASR